MDDQNGHINSPIQSFGLGESEPTVIGSNTPLLLRDPESIWLIYAGAVDVFAVRTTDDGEPDSPRKHLFRANQGQIILGLDLHVYGKGIHILAVGTKNSVVAQLPRADFEALLNDADKAQQTQTLLDEWLQNFSRSVQQQVALRQFVPLSANQAVEVESDSVARPRRGVLWVKALDGAAQFVSKTELPLVTADDFLPVTEHTWLYVENNARLYAIDTEEFVRKAFSWNLINNFHRLVLDCIVWGLDDFQTIERHRIEQQSQHDQHQVDVAFHRLGGVLSDEDEDELLPIDSNDLLLATLQRIGRSLGVKIVPRPNPIDGRDEETTLDAITRTSGVRVRQVALRGYWWQADNGPLLAYLQKTNRPVALIPNSTNNYEMVDIYEQTRQPVTSSVANQLSQLAYSFYRTLPTKILHARDLLRFGLKQAKGDLLNVILMGIAGGILIIAIPLITGRIFDFIIPSADRAQLVQFALLLLTIAIVTAIFQVMRSIAVLRVEMKMDSALQSAVWDRLLNLPAPFFRDYTAGDLSSRALGVSAIRRAVSGTVVRSLLSAIFSIFNFILLFYFSVPLALVATFLVGIAFGVTLFIGNRQMTFQRHLTNIEGSISGMVLQFITGITKFRIAGVEGRAFAQWARRFTEQKQYAYQVGNAGNALIVFNLSFPVISAIVIFALVANITDFSTGEFLAFNVAFTTFLLAGLDLSTALISVLQVVPTYERMQPILETLPEVDETKSDPGELSGEIEVSRVSFRYDEDGLLILKDINFHVTPGDFVAIVGPSGSGKSTLFRLLLGFETPESGGIFYDGQDLGGLDIRAVRQQLGVVLQNGQLMTGDIFTNIVGVAPLTIDDAWEAAEMSGLADDIREMPMGMHTIISEGGSTLSGGQRQRLLIARAIAKKPKILYFDEATSALDNRTQAIVSESLEKLDATRIVIAHRLSTIINADHILVMHHGKLVETGTYDELIRNSTLFADLARRQLV